MGSTDSDPQIIICGLTTNSDLLVWFTVNFIIGLVCPFNFKITFKLVDVVCPHMDEDQSLSVYVACKKYRICFGFIASCLLYLETE